MFTFGYEESGIYAVDADGSRLQTIVAPSVNTVRSNRDRRPVGMMTYFDISPDGSQIVYSTCRYPDSDRLPSSELRFWEFSYEIVVSNIDGTNTRRITNNNHFDNFPVWSPDGSQIAFVSDPDLNHGADNTDEWQPIVRNRGVNDVRGQLMVYTLETGELRNVTHPYGGDRDRVAPHPPAWSPDGQRIAFVAYGRDVEYGEDAWYQVPLVVHTVKPDGSHTHQSWVPSSCYGYWRGGFSHTAADAHLLEWDTCSCCKFDTAGGDQGSTGLHRLDCGGGGEGKRVRQGRGGGG